MESVWRRDEAGLRAGFARSSPGRVSATASPARRLEIEDAQADFRPLCERAEEIALIRGRQDRKENDLSAHRMRT